VNSSFGVEFDDDMMCAVDKLERDYVLKEVNSCHLATEDTQGSNQDVQCHRKEKFSRRKVGATPCGSSRSKKHTSDVDSTCVRSKLADDAMSLTVIKGHNSTKVVSSAHDEVSDQDVICTWNSPLLVSTPLVVSKRRIANENVAKSNSADDAPTAKSEAPKQLNSARKPKTKKVEKTKLFADLLNTSLNAGPPTESASLHNRCESPGCSGRHDSLSGGKGNSSSAISNTDGKLWLICIHFIVHCVLSGISGDIADDGMV